jgi:putative two-component system response regulator
MNEQLRQARLLVADDEPAHTNLLAVLLKRWGFRLVASTNDSSRVLELCQAHDPDLLFLDLHMPEPGGLELLRALEPRIHGTVPLPVIVMTADTNPDSRRAALELGARDFLVKPFDIEEVRLRVRNLLETRFLQREQDRYSARLADGVRQQTRHLELARLEVLERLALAAEFRDDETREHTLRVAHTSACLATALGMTPSETREIQLAAPLHDIGKIAIPDHILLKPGPLTPEERIAMASHVTTGAEILSGSASTLLQIGEQIALTHHERWDGRGYPAGLHGGEIPLAGRIVAVADVFDALTHQRPYKDAWPLEQAVAEIKAGAGSQFDPEVVSAFAQLDHLSLVDGLGAARALAVGTIGDFRPGPA